MGVQHWIELVVILVCFVLAGMASGTETALTSVGRLRVRYLAEEGSNAAKTLQRLQRDPNRFLSTVLLINTVALIIASSSTTLLTDDVFHRWGVPGPQLIYLALAVSLVLSVLLLLLAEVTPKTLAIRYAERNSSLQDIVRVFKQHRHTRLPVFKGDLDHIVGLIHAKDLLLFYTLAGAPEFNVERILRPIQFTPETKKVDELLHEMRIKKVHMMIVVDEYGGTAGLVSLEDLLEEIVGEIRDEYDQAEEEPLKLVSPTEAVVDARYPMEELNSRLGLGINESDEYDSVGGYVVASLGTIPQPGAQFDGG